MRVFKPKLKPMSPAERKQWRSKWISRLVDAGVSFFHLAGKTDHEIWQLKNRHFPVGRVQEGQGLKAQRGSGRIKP